MQGASFLLLCAIGLVLCPRGQTQDLVETFCDDKDVEAAVDLALVTHNGKLLQGNQFALFQIVRALKAVNESTTLYTLHFFIRESDCPAGGDKVWKDCDYLPKGDEAPSPCTAEAYRSHIQESLGIISVQCKRTVEPVVVTERAHCLGCPKDIDVSSEDLKEPMMYSMAKFNAEDGSSHYFLRHEIISATRQVVAGFKYDIHFQLKKSNCSKADFKELTDECKPDEMEPEFANCNSTVYVAPWRREEPETHLNCERERSGFARRRPPGWSPLRHLIDFAAETLSTPKPSASEESQESQEVATQSPAPPATDSEAAPSPEATPDPALQLEFPPAAEPVRPFNCPTKPWKQFVPITPPAPPQEDPTPAPLPQDEPTPAPELTLDDARFSDLDLVG
ncbi:hypothetical protein SKAU_G00048720 [Synaphobranchus kaupii]|uniref:Cystatin kininogen-type domain-containing protein n=1 Tax=Synaphobranchus kaupii TaxID=118154 RepID=A0A9Q1G3J8_SYNKA|nr:hypothetical protein SKAU_G00048720 [Synaphobranchus kaupii]